jgi:hypothetical protein
VRIEILPEARDDLIAGFRFYERQAPGLGSYFRESILGTLTLGHSGIGLSSEKVSGRLWPDKSLTGGYNFTVSTITEIQEAIEKLPAKERSALAAWLRSQDQPRMSEREEAALLASLDKAATELDAGRGVPVERVREMVGKWLTK